MTKKDFELIAKAIKSVVTAPVDQQMEGADYNDGMFDVVSELAKSLAIINPRFNRERFLEACGYND